MHECGPLHMRAPSVLSLCDINISGRLMRQALDQGGQHTGRCMPEFQSAVEELADILDKEDDQY